MTQAAQCRRRRQPDTASQSTELVLTAALEIARSCSVAGTSFSALLPVVKGLARELAAVRVCGLFRDWAACRRVPEDRSLAVDGTTVVSASATAVAASRASFAFDELSHTEWCFRGTTLAPASVTFQIAGQFPLRRAGSGAVTVADRYPISSLQVHFSSHGVPMGVSVAVATSRDGRTWTTLATQQCVSAVMVLDLPSGTVIRARDAIRLSFSFDVERVRWE